jgi:hypothetical protein
VAFDKTDHIPGESVMGPMDKGSDDGDNMIVAIWIWFGGWVTISSKAGSILCIFKEPSGILVVFCHV